MPAASVSCGVNGRAFAHACIEWPSRWWPGTWPSFCQAKLSAKCSPRSCAYEISQAKEFASGSTAYVLPANAENSCAPAHEIPASASTTAAANRLARTSRARRADRGDEKSQAERRLGEREILRQALIGPGARGALGEVHQDQQARPLIGIAPSLEDASQRQREPQRP